MAKKTFGASKNWQDKIAKRNYEVSKFPKVRAKKSDYQVAKEREKQENRVKEFMKVPAEKVEPTELPIEFYLIKLNQILLTTPKESKFYDFLKSMKDCGEKFGRFSDKQKAVINKWKINL